VLLALIVGALRWINSWDYPPFLIMGLFAIVIAERLAEGRFSMSMLWQTVMKAGAFVVLSVVLFLPFQQNYQLPASGFHQLEVRETTPFNQYLIHFGVLLFLAGGFIALIASRGVKRWGPRRYFARLTLVFMVLVVAGAVFAGTIGRAIEASPIDFTITGLSAGGFLRDVFAGIFNPLPGGTPVQASTDAQGASHATPVTAFALFGLAALLPIVWIAMRRLRADKAIQLFVVGMVGLALLLSAGVEMAALDGDIGRMNTMFKFYLHIWVLLASAGAFGAWYVLDVVRPQLRLGVRLPQVRFGRLRPAFGLTGAFAAGATLLVLAALTYPVFATPQRVQHRFTNQTAIQPRTDDGLAYMQGAVFPDPNGEIRLADDFEGIQWMRQNVRGSPTIMEGVTDLYRWGSRYSINTGLPAVAGWDWHQRQQRGDFAFLVTQRQQDVSLFYTTPDVAEGQRLLRKYNVRYVVVGALERLYFPAEGTGKLESGLGGMLELVFQSDAGETKIFEVVPGVAFVSAGP
ncbi:MAG: hypothetical protein IH958_05420, partial [Chloroflexi bacterium]|nr:hypothetical protein [Chloroflexota bacterium]